MHNYALETNSVEVDFIIIILLKK